MLTDYLGIIRTFNRNILLYLTATAILGFALDGGVYSVIFNLYLLRLGYGPEFIGQINSAGLTTFALASLPAGALAGRFPARIVMTLGLALMVAGAIFLPLAELLAPANPRPFLLGGFVGVYLGLAFYFVPAVPFIFDVTQPRERSPVFSAQTALLALSAFVGSLIGGFLPTTFAAGLGISLDQATPYRYTLLVAGVMMIPALYAIWQTKVAPAADNDDNTATLPPVALPIEATTPLQRRWRGIQASAVTLVILLSVVRFFQVTSVGAAATFFNVYMDTELGVATSTIGVVAAVARLVGVPAALLTPLLIMRWGARSTVAFAGVASVVSLMPLAFSPVWGIAGLGYVGIIAFSSMRYPAFLDYSMQKVPAKWRGTLSGAGETAGGLSFATMALLGGYIIANQGFGALFLFSAAFTLFGTFLFWIWFMRPREDPPNPAPTTVEAKNIEAKNIAPQK